ncbi:hypothetical protein [Haliscomenobacter hydrossis]|uniref:Uncharacterized protein n=1 Tax=Haliscomenobacter hydrossis (strain ATCC 27775 / DSM 1100 / LMG 10767 / O) TaxID=760192 RepID=F4L7H8_HALH1|nr:hypothetical protein [Haliscomenobacter hydrossis]AEE54158.1 hypothetical protein Halhy_6339 [Haliscomenobacter hydrossis DSM 1100]
MKTHKAPRKPGMHSLHDPKGSTARGMHSSGISSKTIIIIAAAIIGFLVLMYFMMAG